MTDLTQSIVQELMDYSPETGYLRWLERDHKWFFNGYRTAEGNCANWNSNNADKEAFAQIGSHGYKFGSILGKNYLAHRVIWLWMTGEWPKNQIDHINGIRVDNRFLNLREADFIENNRNQKKPFTNTSGQIGVSFDKYYQKFHAYIYDGTGKRKHIGHFLEFEDAVSARKKAEKEYDYHENHGR